MGYVESFVKNEEAMETIEYLVVLAVVAGLVGIVLAVGKKIKTTGNSLAGNLDNYAKNGN